MVDNNIFGEVGAPFFDDAPVAIIAGGRSLDHFNFLNLRGLCHVIAVKGSIFDLPWADCGVGSDFPRLEEWCSKLESVSMPVYWPIIERLWVNSKLKKPDCLTFLHKLDGFKISENPAEAYAGGTSGFVALNIAVLKRATKIFLFGFDYLTPDTRQHWNEDHYKEKRHQASSNWNHWAHSYRMIAPTLKEMGIDVINASPDSAINCFEKVTINAAMERLDWLRHERSTSLRGREA